MKLLVTTRTTAELHTIIRRAGYHYLVDRQTGEGSYRRRLGTHHYPRFHIYVSGEQDALVINLHLDQKQPTYQGYTAHNAEYDGPAVEREIERLRQAITAAGRAPTANDRPVAQGFFARLFGT